MRRFAAPLILAGSMLAATGCVGTSGRVYVRVGPPPPPVERVVVAPGPGYVWVPGYYRWDGRAYVWEAGRYMVPPRGRRVWVAGHWERHRNGWYFVDGHWR